MTIHVRKSGLLTTLQDLGRIGYQKYGVIVSGAMDSYAHRAANLLVGNDEKEATIEMTVIGADLYFDKPALISICGADFSPSIDGRSVPLWRPVYVQAGTTLRLGAARAGDRSYLAVSGGFDVPMLMDSYSTYLRAALGGYQGRALQAGDELSVHPLHERGNQIIASMLSRCDESHMFHSVKWRISTAIMPGYETDPTIRVLPGNEYSLFDNTSLEQLWNTDYVVQSQSDRMGYRLAGERLHMLEHRELVSEPVTFGTIQVPPDGLPIILMADRQTTGGYPRIAQVISADLPVLAQARIGSSIRFRLVDLREAQEARLLMDLNLQSIRTSIDMYTR